MKQRPDWMDEVDEPASFSITAFDGPEMTGTHLQAVELSRQEYEALKRYLAVSRGLIAPGKGENDLKMAA